MPNIKTFCRIKPTSETYKEHDVSDSVLNLRVPELLKDFNSIKHGVARATINHEFNFDYIFKQDATQEEVFNVAALEIVNGFLTGYNGTIFAYGQTGTGKTFTVEGSAKTYKSRGLEPRALSLIYKELEKRSNDDISIHISYLEIYQEVGYDLLNPGARTQSYVTPFPKVNVLEGHNGMCIVRNLSNHLAASEDVAQSLLLQGQANRKVAATAIHDRSSRSHAVFTIQLTAKKVDSDTVVRSKLHLVDLAGSERVAKTGVLGQQLEEAKSINLSLHYLENVIVALQQESLAKEKRNRARTSVGTRRYNFSASGRPSSADGTGPRHVPYRNSLLTMLLRDSLGGNCMTAMIATISLEISNLGESISTCRFAGRVACIANAVSRNEELDEKSLIKKLKKRIAELEAELACLRLAEEGEKEGGSSTMQLTEEDKMICAQVVKQYLAGRISDPVTAGITNPYKFRECLRILKRVISKGPHAADGNGLSTSLSVNVPQHLVQENGTSPVNGETLQEDTIVRRNVQKLREDGEINNRVTNEPSRETFSKPRRPPVSAWSESTNMSLPTSAASGDQLWRSNSKKEPETLSEILQAGKPRTPYEQKRTVEIKKLNTRVDKIQTERMEKEQEVMDLKIQVAEKELNLMERHMKTKVAVTTAQVEDQRAYIKQLTSTEADPELIAQEKLVERQLRKRQEKYERQLDYIEHRREVLKQRVEGGIEVTEKKASVQEKFGQFRKNDGSLNTRQVFQMLKEEEKKQSRAKTQVEREKILASANLMELKELATRQKLRELKEAMNSGSGFVPIGGVENGQTNGQINGHSERVQASEEIEAKHGAKNPGSLTRDGTFIVDIDSGNTQVGNGQDSAPSPVNGQQHLSGDFYAKRRSEKDPKSKWESSYSRPTTPSNLNIPEAALVLEGNSNDLNGSKASGQNTQENQKTGSHVERRGDKAKADTKNALSEDAIEKQSKKLEEELYNSKTKKFREKHKSLYESPQNLQTLMPSEYVYGTNAEQFDARRMGLSAKTFDTALTSMLGADNTKLIPENKDYEQFARTSKYRPNPYLESKTLTPPRQRSPAKGQRGSSRERNKEREAKTPEKKTREPEASPISAKISRYIQSPNKPQRQTFKGRPSSQGAPGIQQRPMTGEYMDHTVINLQEFDMTKFLNASNSFANSNDSALQIEEEPPHSVRAMPEQEREKTYMSKAQVERDRVNRIRKARQSAEIIQRSWRRYLAKKRRR